jgi:DNA mismatch endonuclease, patch repair protein
MYNMTDIVDRATRSRMMSGIRGKNTKPEMIVRRGLHRLGYRFRLHDRNLPGSPDLALPKWNAVIFVHGCYWHRHTGCKYAYTPKSNTDFWKKKLGRNSERDLEHQKTLSETGWRILIVWECSLKHQDIGRSKTIEQISQWLLSSAQLDEIPKRRELSL